MWNRTIATGLPALLLGAWALALSPALSAGETQDKKDRAELEQQLEAARENLNEAARRVAELSRELGDEMSNVLIREVRHLEGPPHASLGVMIGGTARGPVDGVAVRGVTPGGPAAEAGLKAGDLILQVDGTALAAGDAMAANRKLIEYLRKHEPGTVVTLQYRRDGKTASVEVQTEDSPVPRVFAWAGDGTGFDVRVPPIPPLPSAPGAAGPGAQHFAFLRHLGSGWGDMELVSLSPELGEYFDTERGVLVVRAPGDGPFRLQDGDVILRIGEREVENPVHAMRILRSHAPGETLELTVMRHGDEQTWEVTLPEQPETATPGTAPAPPRVQTRVEVIATDSGD